MLWFVQQDKIVCIYGESTLDIVLVNAIYFVNTKEYAQINTQRIV